MKIHTPDVLVGSYAVNAGDVTLQVVIGDAQVGAWRAAIGGRIFKGGTAPVVIGQGNQLRGQLLNVVVTVSDGPISNRLDEIVRLSGGSTLGDFPQEIPPQEVSDGDLAIFSTLVRLA